MPADQPWATSRFPDVPDDLKGVAEHNAGIGIHDGLRGTVNRLWSILPLMVGGLQRIKAGDQRWTLDRKDGPGAPKLATACVP